MLSVALTLLAGLLPTEDSAPAPKTIVLGFDGLDHALVQRFMAEGRLPHLSRLATTGTFAPLTTTWPPLSNVAWAAANTGSNPGRFGVDGFVGRKFLRDAGGQPVAAPAPFLQLGYPTEVDWPGHPGGSPAPSELNPVQLPGWWTYLDGAGLRVTGVSVPMTSPPHDEGDHTRLLSGLGVKDLSGSPGTWYVFTNDPWTFADKLPGGGRLSKLSVADGGPRPTRMEFDVPGPRNWVVDQRHRAVIAAARAKGDDEAARQLDTEYRQWRRREPAIAVTVGVERVDERAEFDVQGTRFSLAAGEWSDLVPLAFPFHDEYAEHGLARFHVLRLDDEELRLFVTPVHIDPRQPPRQRPLSWPHGFGAELAAELGQPFETLGWTALTNPFKAEDAHFGAGAFLTAATRTMAQRERLLDLTLDAPEDWDVAYHVLSMPDRISHVLYREFDQAAATHDPGLAAEQVTAFGRSFPVGDAIGQVYVEVDRIVGDVLARLDAGEFGPDALLLVVSDHGFASFDRQVDLNGLLHDLDYLALRPDVDRATSGKLQLLSYVDWANTRAYAMGLGKIYLNLEGREPGGSVAPADANRLQAELTQALLAATDGPDGPRLITAVVPRDEVFHGPWVAEGQDMTRRGPAGEVPLHHWDGFADLFVGFAPPYRIAWNTTLGGIDRSTVSDNTERWSGDHASVDPRHIPGVLLSNRPSAGSEPPRLIDIGPTILTRYGLLDAAATMDGTPWPFSAADR